MDKKQKIVIKNMINLSDVLSDVLDDRYKKLSDMYEDIKLSHKRQEKLLKETLVSLKTFWHLVSSSEKYILFKNYACVDSYLQGLLRLTERVESEMENPLYRCRERKKNERKVN